MIYLTGQLLLFLLVTAFLGFVIGWLLRGAMLPVSMLKENEFIYRNGNEMDQPNYLMNAGGYVSGTATKQPEHIESLVNQQ